MTQRALKLGFGLLALVTLASTVSVAAAEEVPFSAELIAVFAGPDKEGALFALEGNATQMGPVTGLARNEARGPRELGVFFLEAANGDTLFCSYEFEFGPPLGVGTYTIESGTGRFEGASGGGVLTVDGSPGDFFIITLDGNLSI